MWIAFTSSKTALVTDGKNETLAVLAEELIKANYQDIARFCYADININPKVKLEENDLIIVNISEAQML